MNVYVLIKHYNYEGYDAPLACFKEKPSAKTLYRLLKERGDPLKLKECKELIENFEHRNDLKDTWELIETSLY